MDFKKPVKDSMESLVKDICDLCKINSVEGDPLPGKPFGEGPAKALEAALELGRSMGFKTENFDNYVGHIEMGEGEELLGILCHADVVPAGEGWTYDPWGSEIDNGIIYGRGTTDDKGPLLTSLYAMKILKDMNIPLKKRVRLIIGTNEETDWRCMEYYLNEVKPELPTIAFSPDSEFPVTYAEMGMIQYTLSRKITEDIEIKAGNAVNAVPSKAKVKIPAEMEADIRKAIADSEDSSIYTLEEEDGKLVLTTRGVGAHACVPQEGRNAIGLMTALLSKVNLTGELKEIADFYNSHFGMTIYGEKMGIDCEDDSGKLTLNAGEMFTENGRLCINCDCRIPVSVTVEEIEEKVKNIISDTVYEFELSSKMDPLYVPKDSELVTKLMDAYRKVTGDVDSVPMSSGGATYSRTMDNCVAFGCLLPGQEDTMHQANEYLEIDKLEIWLQILVEAIYQLAK